MKLDYADMNRVKLARASLRLKGSGSELTPTFLIETKLVHRLEVRSQFAEIAFRHLELHNLREKPVL